MKNLTLKNIALTTLSICASGLSTVGILLLSYWGTIKVSMKMGLIENTLNKG